MPDIYKIDPETYWFIWLDMTDCHNVLCECIYCECVLEIVFACKDFLNKGRA